MACNMFVLVACDGLSRFVFCELAMDTTVMSAARFIHRVLGSSDFQKHSGGTTINLTSI